MDNIIKTGSTLVFLVICSCSCDYPLKGTKQIVSSQVTRPIQRILPVSDTSQLLAGTQDTCSDDLGCLMLTSTDTHGLEAIRSLHRQLDDDANGAVDLSESDDFLREELQYESGAERRQKAFHRNDDMHISVKELWEAWIRSEVHNWTVEQTTEWLSSNVGLPQYVSIFIVNGVTGATLPRLAVSNMQYLSNVLGIKDPIHKQKIALKAMDVVLFGPPKDSSSFVKDVILMTLLVGATIGSWYVYRMNKSSKHHLKRMMKDMESLRKAELALENLQKELERARLEQESAFTEKQDLERRLLEQRGESCDLKTSYSDLEVSQLKSEIEMLRNELQKAEGELEDRCWSPPIGLQQWLQLTHEIENKGYIKKKTAAEKQLQSAREACEKLRKKRSSLVGAFVSTHGKSIDEVDRSIVEARTSLNEVTQELAERVQRWKQIELLCGFNIINNSGLTVLESVLYKATSNGRGYGLKGKANSQDDLDEDSCNFSIASDLLGYDNIGGGADSSESERQEDDDDTSFQSTGSPVEFTVGDSDEVVCRGSKGDELNRDKTSRTHSPTLSPENESAIDHNVLATVKLSSSETSLDAAVQLVTTEHKRPGNHHIEGVSSAVSLEEEAYSTDSNSTVADESGAGDRNAKRNKLRFPKFTRKSRYTPPPEKHT